MAREDDYRRNASDTIDLARRAAGTANKIRLLKLAESWLDLADRAHGHDLARRRQTPNTLHPLVRAKIGRYLQD
jgi:hypothetical protein